MQELILLKRFLVEPVAANTIQGSGLMVDILHCRTKKERYILRQGFSVLLNCPRWDVDPLKCKNDQH